MCSAEMVQCGCALVSPSVGRDKILVKDQVVSRDAVVVDVGSQEHNFDLPMTIAVDQSFSRSHFKSLSVPRPSDVEIMLLAPPHARATCGVGAFYGDPRLEAPR